MQIVIHKKSNQNYITNVGENDEFVLNLHVRTQEDIGNMSRGTLRSYRRRVKEVRERVHEFGTGQAIKAIDYLTHAVDGAWTLNGYDTNA